MKRRILLSSLILLFSSLCRAEDHKNSLTTGGSAPRTEARLECLDFRSSHAVPNEIRMNGLDPFWNLEYPGIDLAQESISQFEKKNGELKPIRVIPVEAGTTKEHTEAVMALIQQTSLKGRQTAPAFDKNSEELVRVLKKLVLDKPHVVNFSQSIGNSDAIFEQFQRLSQIAIPVVGAGDDYPFQPEANDLRVDAIIVGSLHPYGFLSHFSEEPDRVRSESGIDVMVPSDLWLVYKDKLGEFKNFGYNSGAAPQVTGVIADLASILPGISLDEARYMLRESAIPTTGLPPRIFNAYHLIRWALRLRELGGGTGWRRLIHIERPLNDFNSEASTLLAEAKALSEKSLRGSGKSKEGCDLLEQAIRKARGAFLLTSYSTRTSDRELKKESKQISADSAELLSRLYEKLGLAVHAEFYQNQDHQKLMANLEDYIFGEDEEDGRSAVRQAAQHGIKGMNLIKRALTEAGPKVREWAVHAGAENAVDPWEFLGVALKAGKSDPSDPVLKAVAFTTSAYEGADAISPYLESFSSKLTLDEMNKLLNGLVLHTLLKMKEGSNTDLEMETISSLQKIGSESLFKKEFDMTIANSRKQIEWANSKK